jgi:hypothetical protein
MRIVMALTLAIVVVACAPRATTPFDPVEGAQAFSLLVDGVPAVRAGEAHGVRTDDYSLDAVLEHDRVLIDVTNHTDAMLRLHPDQSSFVLTDGSTSPLVTGATSWDTRDAPQPAIEIPPDLTASVILIPRDSLRWSDGLVIEPMFAWPVTDITTLRVVLAMELHGEVSEVVLIFTGRPR